MLFYSNSNWKSIEKLIFPAFGKMLVLADERQNSFNCVSLLVCFHAFWMCFPFVVCSCVFSIYVHVWCFFLWLSCVSNFLFATSICADDMCSRSWFCAKSPHVRKPMKMKDKILSIVFPFWCVFHAFWMCFPFVVCSCVFSICVHVWCFFLWLSCVSNFLFATSICADDMCSRSWFCAKSPHVRKPMKMKDKILSIVFPFWCVFMPFGCVFPLLCVHVSFRYVFTCGVFFCDYHVCPISFLRRLFVQMTCALASLREIPTFKKTNENERQNSFNCVSLFGVFSCLLDVFSLCCVFMCLFDMCSRVVFFLWLSCVSNFLFATSICADDMCSRSWFCAKSPHVRKPMKMKDKILSIVFPFWCVFMPFGCVFPLLCVHVSFRYVFTCGVFFCDYHPFCDIYLCRWHVLSILVLREIPTCKKTNENERQNSFNCVSLLVCFHAFWMCFRFVVCSCVFSICVHVWCFFLWLSCVSNFLFATSICADDMCSRSWFCAKSPHVRKPMKMKDKILSIVFPFWCVFMPFGCVFPLLCVHVSFRYVFMCGVFFCDYHVCPISFLRHLFVQMTCALDLGFTRNPHMQENQWKWKTKFFQLCFPFGVFSCLLDVFSLCCVFMCLFDMCSRVVFFSVIIMCVQFPFCDVYLCRWHVLSILVLREIPTCKKTNENERQNSFNCVSLLVCFHAFWMCFPFVVCSCVFSICVHAWCFFCDYHVCPTSFLRRLFVQMTCALDLGFARNPHM